MTDRRPLIAISEGFADYGDYYGYGYGRPLLAAQAYGLPPWTTPDTTVLCSSYSGDTEETLTVTREGSKLFVDIPINQKTELFAESESKFFLKIAPRRQVIFIRDDRHVTHLELVAVEGWTMRAKKIK